MIIRINSIANTKKQMCCKINDVAKNKRNEIDDFNINHLE